MESETSQTLHNGKMNDDIAEQLLTESSSDDASGDENMSDDEEACMKAQLKMTKANRLLPH